MGRRRRVNKAKISVLVNAQLLNQRLLFIKGAYDNFKQDTTKIVPCDDVSLSSYHIQQLMSEIGEVLGCDKRARK